MPFNSSTTALLGHRFQARVENSVTSEIQIASRVQRWDPQVRMDTTIYHEIGSVDPTGSSSEAPEHRITLEEFVHASNLDKVLAGKVQVDTAWNLGQYNQGTNPYNLYLLSRDNAGALAGELKFSAGVLSEIQWQWRSGNPITATYTFDCRLGQNFKVGQEIHTYAAQDTSSPGGIRIKDARLYLGGTTDSYRVYRLQGFTVRSTWRTNAIREAGNRAVVGYVAEPPDTTLDLDFSVADQQPDDVLYASATDSVLSKTYYDYQNANQITSLLIKVFSPTASEGSSVIRTWLLENVLTSNASPLTAVVRGVATKRYSLMLNKVTTAGTAGLKLWDGDYVP